MMKGSLGEIPDTDTLILNGEITDENNEAVDASDLTIKFVFNDGASNLKTVTNGDSELDLTNIEDGLFVITIQLSELSLCPKQYNISCRVTDDDGIVQTLVLGTIDILDGLD